MYKRQEYHGGTGRRGRPASAARRRVSAAEPALCDVFAAVTTERPYGEAWTLEEGRELVRRASGIHFDPICVEAFLENWEQIVAIQDYFGPDEIPGSASLAS